MAFGGELRHDRIIGSEKPFGVSLRRDLWPALFALAGRLVRILCPVIEVAVMTVFHAGQNLAPHRS